MDKEEYRQMNSVASSLREADLDLERAIEKCRDFTNAESKKEEIVELQKQLVLLIMSFSDTKVVP